MPYVLSHDVRIYYEAHGSGSECAAAAFDPRLFPADALVSLGAAGHSSYFERPDAIDGRYGY